MEPVDNMKIWNAIHKPPKGALKEIRGGRLAGKTDINPQWRMQAMTELFGPCGIGWKYTIDKLWTEQGFDAEICSFALVSVSTCTNGVWSEPIPGIGGSMLIAKEKSGPYTSDEAYKMAVTDALSVAFKALGMAAEIYLGNYDGSKYKDAPKWSDNSKHEHVRNDPLPPDLASVEEKKVLAKALAEYGYAAKPAMRNYIKKHSGKEPEEITGEDVVNLMQLLSERAAIQAEGGE